MYVECCPSCSLLFILFSGAPHYFLFGVASLTFLHSYFSMVACRNQFPLLWCLQDLQLVYLIFRGQYVYPVLIALFTWTACIALTTCLYQRHKKIMALMNAFRLTPLVQQQWVRASVSYRLIPGDVIVLQRGRATCDMCILQGACLVNESVLSGEVQLLCHARAKCCC